MINTISLLFYSGLGTSYSHLLMTLGRVKMVLNNLFATAFGGDYQGTFVTNRATHRSTRQPTRPQFELVWNPNQTFLPFDRIGLNSHPTHSKTNRLPVNFLSAVQPALAALPGPSILRDSKCSSHHPVGTPSCTVVRQDKE